MMLYVYNRFYSSNESRALKDLENLAIETTSVFRRAELAEVLVFQPVNQRNSG
jgi:hypothetical protein